MYTAFWKLREPPFRNEFRRSYYFPSASHQAAMLKLRYAIEQRLPAVLLVGMAGTGKTFLSHLVTESLPDSIRPVIRQVCLFEDAADLVEDFAYRLAGGSPKAGSGYAAFRRIEEALAKNREQGRHALLVLDNTHVFQHHQTWDVLRSLITLDVQGQTACTVLLIGHPLLLPVLERLPHVEELMSLKCLLRPLTVTEAGQYVEHCLQQAGCSDPVFTPEALNLIAELSGGVPRRINRLADLSLVVAYAEKSPQVLPGHVEAVFEELAAVPAQ